MVKVDIEYCGRCNFEWECKALSNFLHQEQPDTDVVCRTGRQGAFEVTIDEKLVHSKLKSLAFPDHKSVLENVQRAKQGEPLIKTKEQPIENCSIQ